jgi:hypothetical protein
MPNAAQPINITAQPGSTGNLSLNIVGANAGVQLKTGAGSLQQISLNTVGTTSTIVLYDGISTAGKKLGTWSTAASNILSAIGQVYPNLAYTTGLFAVTTGTVADVTVGFR